jgi:hypothetical protein
MLHQSNCCSRLQQFNHRRCHLGPIAQLVAISEAVQVAVNGFGHTANAQITQQNAIKKSGTAASGFRMFRDTARFKKSGT